MPRLVLGPNYEYDATIGLDAANLTPKLSLVDLWTRKATPISTPATIVRQDQPLLIRFAATAAKYDVTWRLRFDYVVDGKAESSCCSGIGRAVPDGRDRGFPRAVPHLERWEHVDGVLEAPVTLTHSDSPSSAAVPRPGRGLRRLVRRDVPEVMKWLAKWAEPLAG